MRFPKVSGSNLLRQKLYLPGSLEGKINLLFIPFQQWQQSMVDGWVPMARRLEQEYSGMAYYELPTIQPMGWLAQTMLNEGMRAGIPNQKTRERTITLYLDKVAFRRELGIEGEDQITVLLVDRQGNILWRTVGAYTPDKEIELRRHLAGFAASNEL